nr:uncharacterized protein LOC104098476 [Ipomoea batatas]
MGFHNWTGKYKKLDHQAAAKATEPTRRRRWRRWMKVNRRVTIRGLRLSRFRKLKIEYCKGAIGKIYGEVVKRVMGMGMGESVCPQILLCCHWGLPVLSHSIPKSAKNHHAPLRGV